MKIIQPLTPLRSLEKDGYLVFPEVIPAFLMYPSIDEINNVDDEFWPWFTDRADQFKGWLQSFLARKNLNTVGRDTVLQVFNRNVGGSMCWHEDEDGSHTPRIFICCYLTPTTEGRGALKILPDSHNSYRADFSLIRQELADLKALRYPGNNADGDTRRQHPALYATYRDEMLLEVPAGSIVIGDRRLIHRASENRGPGRRTMVLWWQTLCEQTLSER